MSETSNDFVANLMLDVKFSARLSCTSQTAGFVSADVSVLADDETGRRNTFTLTQADSSLQTAILQTPYKAHSRNFSTGYRSINLPMGESCDLSVEPVSIALSDSSVKLLATYSQELSYTLRAVSLAVTLLTPDSTTVQLLASLDGAISGMERELKDLSLQLEIASDEEKTVLSVRVSTLKGTLQSLADARAQVSTDCTNASEECQASITRARLGLQSVGENIGHTLINLRDFLNSEIARLDGVAQELAKRLQTILIAMDAQG